MESDLQYMDEHLQILDYSSSAVALDAGIAYHARGRIGCKSRAGLNASNKLIRVKISAANLYLYVCQLLTNNYKMAQVS